MRKWLIPILCLLLILAAAVPAAAEEGTVFKIIPSQTEAAPGDTLTFTVKVESSGTCKSYGLVLSFDSAVFEMVSGECTAENAALAVFDQTRGFAVMLNAEGNPSGELGSFTLKVKGSAAAGDTVISGESAVKTGSNTLASNVVAATVRISAPAGQTQPAQTEQDAQQTEAAKDTESTQPAETAVQTQPAEEPTVEEQSGNVEYTGETAPLLGGEEEGDQPLNIWWLIIGGAGLLGAVILIILLTAKKPGGGKYLRKG